MAFLCHSASQYDQVLSPFQAQLASYPIPSRETRTSKRSTHIGLSYRPPAAYSAIYSAALTHPTVGSLSDLTVPTSRSNLSKLAVQSR